MHEVFPHISEIYYLINEVERLKVNFVVPIDFVSQNQVLNDVLYASTGLSSRLVTVHTQLC